MENEIDNITFDLEDHIGETVTIFTTSGGESGQGFTGVVIRVRPCFVRLITRIGPPPACSLGNACCCGFRRDFFRRDCDFVRTLGAEVDIPLNRIAAVVFNTV